MVYNLNADDAVNGKKAEKGKKTHLKEVLMNKNVIIVSIAYALHTFCIIGMATWGQLFYMEQHQYTIADAAKLLVTYEVGGFIGATSSGVFSDFISKTSVLTCSPRSLVSFINSILVIIACLSINVTPGSWTASLTSFAYGFGCFGSVAMYGLMGRELVKYSEGDVVSSIINFSSQIGGFCAGLPLSYFSSVSTSFVVITASAGLCSTILFVLCFILKSKNKVE